MTKIFIMAQGRGRRWKPHDGRLKDLPSIKHLIAIGKYGAPIISRTQILITLHSQHLPMKIEYTVVATPWDSGQSPPTHFFTLAEPTGPLIDGIYQTRPMWGERVIFLLGDVVFSHALIDVILLDTGELTFFGRLGPNPVTGKAASELFGVAIAEERYEDVLAWMAKATARGSEFTYPCPRLWDLYYNFEDQGRLVSLKGDYTDDIDSIQEYDQFWHSLNREAAEDDDSCWCDLRRKELFP